MLLANQIKNIYSHTHIIMIYMKSSKILQKVPTEIWIKILSDRMKLADCIKKGWVMEGFPHTRQQALALQVVGICAKHTGELV